MTTPTLISLLPEVQNLILSQLDLPQLISIRRVCKTLKHLSQILIDDKKASINWICRIVVDVDYRNPNPSSVIIYPEGYERKVAEYIKSLPTPVHLPTYKIHRRTTVSATHHLSIDKEFHPSIWKNKTSHILIKFKGVIPSLYDLTERRLKPCENTSGCIQRMVEIIFP